MAPDTPSINDRSHHLDAARTFLMLLGIPYHSALLFQKEIPWAASAGTSSPVALYIVALIHIFRMPAFFMLSGYLAAIVLMRADPVGWLKRRYLSLGIPLIFSMIVLQPVQVLVPAWLVGDDLRTALTGKGVGHLWFLFALLGISPLALILQKPLRHIHHLRPGTLAVGIYIGIALAIALATMCRDLVSAHDYPLHNTITAVVWGTASGAPFFVVGLLLMHRPDVARALTLTSPAAYAALLGLMIAYAAVMPPKVDTMISTVTAALLAIPIAMGIILFCSRRLSARSAAIATATRSSFTVYLVHHPIVIILGAATAALPLPWFQHFILICLVTSISSFGIWYAVRDVRGVNLLLGAKPFPKQRTPASGLHALPKARR